MESTAYIARQPILDRKGNLFAYELLFRNSKKSDAAILQNGVTATAKVLENAVNGIGLPELLGSVKGFVNFNREMLLGRIPTLLDPDWFVIEILEDVEPDEDVVKAVIALKEKGFTLALDDFIFDEENCKRCSPLFPYVSYVKMDLVENSPEARDSAVAYFKARHISLLAEKVETQEEFNACLNDGYDYFQGYFFARPELVAGNVVPASASALLQLMRNFRYGPTLDEFLVSLSKFPEVENSLIRYVSSSSSAKNARLDSAKEALEWIGLRNVHSWLMLMLYSRSVASSTAFMSPLFRNASHRAKFMENLALSIAPNHPNFFADAFLVGILSRIDAFVDVPLAEALQRITVAPEVREAIAEKKGPLGYLLRLANAVESDDQAELNHCMHKLFVTPEMLQSSLQNAFAWANNA